MFRCEDLGTSALVPSYVHHTQRLRGKQLAYIPPSPPPPPPKEKDNNNNNDNNNNKEYWLKEICTIVLQNQGGFRY